MGFTAGESISAAPGKTAFNPLFLFGGPGLGKTHLAQAIGIAIKKRYPELVVLYVPANRFKIQYMDATNVRNKLTDFLAFYMKIDVLIVDDIQDLQSPGCQNAFFNIFNHLHQSGKQLIFTSDRPSVELENFVLTLSQSKVAEVAGRWIWFSTKRCRRSIIGTYVLMKLAVIIGGF